MPPVTGPVVGPLGTSGMSGALPADGKPGNGTLPGGGPPTTPSPAAPPSRPPNGSEEEADEPAPGKT
ncbi:hypothetical protein ACFOSC_02905 [Streptantibioticus rubrisoli]|uniref:Uncharacterized protein n=1 Tax=Streptantibioticus rubrisoli TaxID=1387313 RepID=A0ABT1PF51_9ACTN|nr:hypothetical protein [Streptantibioticus rubrisoli]MCQ4043997.1 hypothetical protein [Streptantibioticus rubrisoli]